MPDPDVPDPVDLYEKVLADVKSGGVTDDGQAEELADQISTDILDGLAPRDGDSNGEPPPGAVEELRAVAEDLREERERLEWTATQVAHLAETRGPSVDPDPTPPAPLEVQKATAEAGAGPAAEPNPAAEADGLPQAPAPAPGPDAQASETTDPELIPGTQRRGGRLVTIVGVLLMLLAAAVLVSRAVA